MERKRLLSPSIKEKLRFRKNLRILLKRMCRYKAFLVCGWVLRTRLKPGKVGYTKMEILVE